MNRATEQVDYLVSEYRYKENMTQLVLATSGGAKKNRHVNIQIPAFQSFD